MNRKINNAISILFMLGIIAMLFSGAVAAVEGDKLYGDDIGVYKKIVAKSNGPCVNKFEGFNEGKDCAVSNYWQCVEYVKRFYTELLDTSQWTGLLSASQYYTNAEARGLTPYPNGGSMPPQPDDILGFSGGIYGHVAIITEVGDTYVNVIEQNVARNDAMGPPNHQIPYDRITNMIGDENGFRTDIGLYVQGWIRKDVWSFNSGKMDNLDMAERWEAHYVESSEMGTDGKYRINPGIDPWIQHDKLSIVAINYNAIEINMASNAPDGMGKIYFVTESSPIYDENKHVDFYVINDGYWRTHTISMKNAPYWSGTITGLRIDPATTGKAGTDNTDIIGFDWIKAIKTNMKPSIVSASPDYSVYSPGSTVTFSYWINNPFANDLPDTKLYAAIQYSGSGTSTGWLEDNYWLYNNPITLYSGTYFGTSRYEKRYLLPSFSVSEGSYDAYLRVYDLNTNDEYDYKYLFSSFAVNSGITPTPTPTVLPTSTAVTPAPTIPESTATPLPTLTPIPTNTPTPTPMPTVSPPYEAIYENSIVTNGAINAPNWWLENGFRRKIMDDITFQSIFNSNGNKYWIFSDSDINKISQGADILISPPSTPTPTPTEPSSPPPEVTPTPTPTIPPLNTTSPIPTDVFNQAGENYLKALADAFIAENKTYEEFKLYVLNGTTQDKALVEIVLEQIIKQRFPIPVLNSIARIDFDSDGIMTTEDLIIVASYFGEMNQTLRSRYDVNQDGAIDIYDAVLVSLNIE